MRKVILFVLLISLFFVTGCNCGDNNKLSFYDEETKWNEYLDLFYEEINTEGRKYVAVDLRNKEAYETEHLRQFQNYDLSVGSIDDLIMWLSSNYSNKYVVYIYIETLNDLSMFDSIVEKYKQVCVYIGDYSKLRTIGDELFTFDSGPYDCNC